jgi:dUTPase
MLITGNQITDQALLANADPKNIRGGCYYLRIHSIIPTGEEAKTYDPSKPTTFYTLEPGGLAWVISEEKFQIEDARVTALVTLRSGFTKQGMLALDVGLVDANFFGPIGSLVINFSKKPIRLKAGDEFFRVLFFQHDEAKDGQVPKLTSFTHSENVEKILTDMVGGFSGTFLQTAEMEKRIREDLKNDITNRLEPDLLDKFASRFFQKNWLKLIGLLAAAVLSGYFFGVTDYLHSKEQINELIQNQLEALGIHESTSPVSE